MNKRGYAGLGFYQAKHDTNIGTGFRTALAFGLDFLCTIGHKYKKQSTDTCDSTKHLPYYHYQCYDDLVANKPEKCEIVCIEITKTAHNLVNFIHPERCLYLVGNEGYGIHEKYLNNHQVVYIPSKICLNVAVAASLVLWDRIVKGNQWKNLTAI